MCPSKYAASDLEGAETVDRPERICRGRCAAARAPHRRWLGRLVAPERRQRCHFDPDGRLPWEDQASPSMVQPTGIKQKASPSDISTMPSGPTLMCCPEEIWTAPVPGGALAERSRLASIEPCDHSARGVSRVVAGAHPE